MQGWGSILSVLFAALAFGSTIFLIWWEMKARREDRLEREAAQGRLIFVKLQAVRTVAELELQLRPRHMAEVSWKIENHSNGPIFAARGVLFRNDGHQQDGCSIPQTDLPPGQVMRGRWRLDPPIPWDGAEEEPPLGVITSFIEFMDSAGLVWTRQDREPPQPMAWPKDPTLWSRAQTYLYLRHQERAGRSSLGISAKNWRASRRRPRGGRS